MKLKRPTCTKLLNILVLGYCCLQAIANAANPIEIENRNPGSRGWEISNSENAWNDEYNGVRPTIKGYMSATSVNKGGQIGFKVSVAPAANYSIEVYRMGYYGGTGGRLMTTIGPLAGSQQARCIASPPDPNTIADCNWPTGHTLRIPSSWTSGIYLAKLKRLNDGISTGTIFVVRDDYRSSAFLYQQPVTTYQAYNLFPLGFGGKSLYKEGIDGDPSTRAYKVSFNRPYDGDYKGYSYFFFWEFPLVKWLEKMGYDVSYSTNLDTHLRGRNLLWHRAFLSTGHDEYWSKDMRDAVEIARNNRVNLAFFGGNAAYWQVRFENDKVGSPNRVMVCYKDKELDPIANPSLKTYLFRDPESVNRPEQNLLGVQYISYYNYDKNQPLVVKNTSHWAFKDSGLSEGAQIPGIVGYEVDTIFPNLMPDNTDFTVLAESPFLDIYGNTPLQNTVIFRTTRGGWVFSSGTMSWSWALDFDSVNAEFGDFRSTALQKVTQNIMDRFRSFR